MTIYVYHNTKRGSLFNDNAHECRVAIRGGYLHMVAKVETDDLETAFRLTNNIDSSWIDNEGVDPCKVPDGARSTSVGDVFVLDREDGGDERVYMVGGFGFEELNIFPDRLIQSDMMFYAKNRAA